MEQGQEGGQAGTVGSNKQVVSGEGGLSPQIPIGLAVHTAPAPPEEGMPPPYAQSRVQTKDEKGRDPTHTAWGMLPVLTMPKGPVMVSFGYN